MKQNKYSLEEFIDMIEPRRRKVCKKIFVDYQTDINSFPGAKTKHQNWRGGYKDHLEETMNIALILYEILNSKRELCFDKSDVIFTLFLHDFDKIFRYKIKNENQSSNRSSYHRGILSKIRRILRNDYDYTLSEIEWNVLNYVHGENDDYHPTNRVMLPLTAFIHCCDIISARIWFDKGRDEKCW